MAMQTYIGQFDVFDAAYLSNYPNYGGDIGLCAVLASSLMEALQMAITEITSDGATLKKIDYFGPPQSYSKNIKYFGVTLAELGDALSEEHRIVFCPPLRYDAG